MSVDRTVYIGWYLKVWMPKKEIESCKKFCPECGEGYYNKFCPDCGHALQPLVQEVPQDIYDYLDKVFGEECGESYFTSVHDNPMGEPEEDLVIILPNNSDMKCGYYLDEHEFEQPLAFGQVTHRAWDTLVESLTTDCIKHKLVCGVVNYYS